MSRRRLDTNFKTTMDWCGLTCQTVQGVFLLWCILEKCIEVARKWKVIRLGNVTTK